MDENENSLNNETSTEGIIELDALKQQVKDTEEKNRQLFERAKKAETEAKELKEKLGSVKPAEKSNKLDYAQKAFILASGYKSDELSHFEEAIETTGKSLEDLIGSTWFQKEMAERREAKATADATPSGSPRGTQISARDTVEYWLAKGELPPLDQRKLREEYVNAKLRKVKDDNKFTDNPVVM